MNNEQEVKDELLPTEIDTLPLEEETKQIIADIVKAKDVDSLKELTDIFAINQAKKNALRIVKLNNLLDAVNDQAIERFERRPDEISNKEILDYMKVVQEQINNSNRTLESIDTKPMIQINKNEVNINVEKSTLGQLNEDEKEKVKNAIQQLLKQAQNAEVVEPITENKEGNE